MVDVRDFSLDPERIFMPVWGSVKSERSPFGAVSQLGGGMEIYTCLRAPVILKFTASANASGPFSGTETKHLAKRGGRSLYLAALF